ncbi:Uncharacterised protein [uncultured archaeon]|nr:Uncharacterised protein [uncultured archaeon]
MKPAFILLMMAFAVALSGCLGTDETSTTTAPSTVEQTYVTTTLAAQSATTTTVIQPPIEVSTTATTIDLGVDLNDGLDGAIKDVQDVNS